MKNQSAAQNAILFQLTFDTSVPKTEKRFDRGADFIERCSAKLWICGTYDTTYAGFDPTVTSYVFVTAWVRGLLPLRRARDESGSGNGARPAQAAPQPSSERTR